jgi:hypothetical protein
MQVRTALSSRSAAASQLSDPLRATVGVRRVPLRPLDMARRWPGLPDHQARGLDAARTRLDVLSETGIGWWHTNRVTVSRNAMADTTMYRACILL